MLCDVLESPSSDEVAEPSPPARKSLIVPFSNLLAVRRWSNQVGSGRVGTVERVILR